MGGGVRDQNYLTKINEYDIDEVVSPLCDDALEEVLIGPNGQFKPNEQAATLKGKLRSDCKDFKRLSLPYEHLMLQVINLVEDVINKNISFEIGKRLAEDVQKTFSKFKSKDDSYEKSKRRGLALKRRCTHCINMYHSYIEKVNELGIESKIEDMILSHYLEISVVPVLDLYRDIVISYDALIKSYEDSEEFFNADWERSYDDEIQSSSSSCGNRRVKVGLNQKNTFLSLAPAIIVIGLFLITTSLMRKYTM